MNRKRATFFFRLIVSLLLLFSLLKVDAAGEIETIVYPRDANIINVKESPYNAYGDGLHDDTAALQKAISDHLNNSKIIYLPNGVYLLSDRLQWRSGTTGFSAGWGAYLTLQGQSETKTILKLKDYAQGYTNPTHPKAVVYTASRDDQNTYDDATGPGNQAFDNFIRNLTIDVGSGNAGAIGIDYQVSNWGALRNVTVRSSDPKRIGRIGVSMTRRDNGPGLLKNVTVDGFSYGIKISGEPYSLTLENIALNTQQEIGLQIKDLPVSIRSLLTNNAKTAIQISGIALVNLIDARLTGGTSSEVAINNIDASSHLYARNVSTSGYKAVIQNRDSILAQDSLTEFVSDKISGSSSALQRSLNLPIKEMPTYFNADLTQWQSVTATGAVPEDSKDDTEGIQQALNSGKSTVYFPNGSYRISDTLRIPSTVKHVIGLESRLYAAFETNFNDAAKPHPIFRVEGKEPDTLFIEGFHVEVKGSGTIGIEHASTRSIAIRDSLLGGSITSYRSTSNCGELFLENVLASLQLSYSQKVWARQLDEEQADSFIVNNAAELWILGLKSENLNTILRTQNGGRTELLGGSINVFGKVPNDVPIFINENANVSFSFAGIAYSPGFFFTNLIREIRNGRTEDIPISSAHLRGLGTSMPLYVSANDPKP